MLTYARCTMRQPDVDALVKEVEAAAIATESPESSKDEPAPVPQIVEPVGAPVDQKEEVSTVKAEAAAEGAKEEAAAEGTTETTTAAAPSSPAKSPSKEKKGFSIGGLFKSSKSPKVSCRTPWPIRAWLLISLFRVQSPKEEKKETEAVKEGEVRSSTL